MLNPVQCRGQVEGGVAQNGAFRHYRIPAWADVPEAEAHFANTHGAFSPMGAKSMSESRFNPAGAAMANALADATGLRFTAPPFTRDRVSSALQIQD